MKRSSISLVLMLLVACLGYAQGDKSAVIKFEKTTHDFGKIQEEKGPVTYVFKFTNTGNFPLVVNNVTASCGCTTPDWTKEPLAPGKSGSVKVTFDPRNRPGMFMKTINVQSNSKEALVRLQIQGEVLSQLPAEEDGYPASIGDLRMSSRSLYFGDILDSESKTLSIQVYNTGISNLSLDFSGLPIYLKASSSPNKTIAPKQKGTITFVYNAQMAKDYGIKENNFYLLVGGAKLTNPDNRLFVSANIKEDFSKLTPQQRENGPKSELSVQTLDFGKLDFKENKTMDLTITNSGKSTLFIRKITCPNKAVKLAIPKSNIAAGGTINIKVSINESQLKTRIVDRITIITNDPNASMQSVSVLASTR